MRTNFTENKPVDHPVFYFMGVQKAKQEFSELQGKQQPLWGRQSDLGCNTCAFCYLKGEGVVHISKYPGIKIVAVLLCKNSGLLHYTFIHVSIITSFYIQYITISINVQLCIKTLPITGRVLNINPTWASHIII